MSVTAPPRPPRPDEQPARDDSDALVEALIEEARERARHRRQKYAAVTALLAFLGLTLFAVIERSARTLTTSPAGSGRPSLVAGTADARIAFIAAKWYANHPIALDNELSVLDVDQGGRRVLTHDAELLGLAWSPDGRKVAFVNPRAGPVDVYVMNADGSGQRRLTHGRDYERNYAPAWSPDGRKLAFVGQSLGGIGPSGYRIGDIYVINADGSRKRRLASETAPAAGLAWSPDGRKLIVAVAAVLPGPRTIEFYLVNADGSGQRKLTTTEGPGSPPVWSPDGRKIAFASHSVIYVINADGSGLHRLTNHGLQPAWSPDGRTIAFASRRGKYSEIYLMNADGTNQRILTSRGARPVWSPDGARIAFQSSRDGNPELYVINADGTDQRRLTHDPLHELFVVWSPAQSHDATRR